MGHAPQDPFLPLATPPKERHGCFQNARRWLLVAILLGLATLHYTCTEIGKPHDLAIPHEDTTRLVNHPELIWNQIVPNPNLTWTSCFVSKECAKFSVPLDYSDPSGPQAAIALLRVPAKVPPTDTRYRGPVLINPGGPGGSGVGFALGLGEYLQTIIGDEHDIVGFDPRGVGLTIPKMEVFNSFSEWATWTLRTVDIPPLGSTPNALARDVAQWSVLGDLGKRRLGPEAQYVSTAYVARDMLRITEAHGFDKLKFMGYSYGSVLGITFASMFPDRVERLIVDGVCDTEDYYQAQWSNNLRDTNASMEMFYSACSEAGPASCVLYEPTADAVKTRAENIFNSIKARPIALLSSSNGTSASDYGILDYRIVRSLVLLFLYSPYSIPAHGLAEALVGIERRDAKSFFDFASALIPGVDFKCDCDTEQSPLVFPEALLSIACSDGDVVGDSVGQLQTHYEGMARSSSFAELWNIRIRCSGWKIRAKERFRGPWVGNTSFPIMLIGNTADPVTPLWNAHKMAEGFKDAVVLEQNSGGHSSLAAVSLCTAKILRGYFRDGQLPEYGTECEVQSKIFGLPSGYDSSLTSEDKHLVDAMSKLSQNYRPPQLHMGSAGSILQSHLDL